MNSYRLLYKQTTELRDTLANAKINMDSIYYIYTVYVTILVIIIHSRERVCLSNVARGQQLQQLLVMSFAGLAFVYELVSLFVYLFVWLCVSVCLPLCVWVPCIFPVPRKKLLALLLIFVRLPFHFSSYVGRKRIRWGGGRKGRGKGETSW